MKKLACVLPVSLQEDGTLQIRHFKSLTLLLDELKREYEITLLVQTYREKRIPELDRLGFRVFYDNSPQREGFADRASRFQVSYCRWADRVSFPKQDCLLAWDGCSPWCLATALTCVQARRRVLWLHEDPHLYLMRTDHDFYADLCGGFDAVIASSEQIRNCLLAVAPQKMASVSSAALALPVDSAWYWAQSEELSDVDFMQKETNLLAISRMSISGRLEQLPAWLAARAEQKPSIHIYLIGDGPRMDHYLQQTAIYDVDSSFTLLGDVGNIYPWIRACDGLIVCDGDRNPEAETAAGVFGVPVLSFDEFDSDALSIPEKKQSAPENGVWPDRERLIRIIEGI